jgi:hypothetical protein
LELDEKGEVLAINVCDEFSEGLTFATSLSFVDVVGQRFEEEEDQLLSGEITGAYERGEKGKNNTSEGEEKAEKGE